jgi:hypothetical protein
MRLLSEAPYIGECYNTSKKAFLVRIESDNLLLLTWSSLTKKRSP